MKTLIKKIIAGVMVLCWVSTLNCQTTYAKEYNNEEIIIGEYDGPLQDFSVQTNNSRSISNVRIYSYATYDRSTGIKVHIKLYVPAWESPQPEFTAMSGIVSKKAIMQLHWAKKQYQPMYRLEFMVLVVKKVPLTFLVWQLRIMPWATVVDILYPMQSLFHNTY